MPRAAVRALFPVDEAVSEPDYWTLRYADDDWCTIHVTPHPADPALIQSLCVFRPGVSLRLWDALAEVLRMGQVVLYYPGGAGPLVADPEAAGHMPHDMAAVIGPPRVVRSGRDVLADIQSS